MRLITLTGTMNTVGTLLLGAITDGGTKTDKRWLTLLLASLDDSGVNGLEVTNPTLGSWFWTSMQYLRITVVDV